MMKSLHSDLVLSVCGAAALLCGCGVQTADAGDWNREEMESVDSSRLQRSAERGIPGKGGIAGGPAAPGLYPGSNPYWVPYFGGVNPAGGPYPGGPYGGYPGGPPGGFGPYGFGAPGFAGQLPIGAAPYGLGGAPGGIPIPYATTSGPYSW